MITDSLIRRRCREKVGFTLVEILVSTAVLLIVILVTLQVTAEMGKMWQRTNGTISEFQAARTAFTTINRVLSGATLHTYQDYIDTTSNSPFGVVRTTSNAATFTVSSVTPTARASELHFVSGPAPQLLGQGGNATLYPGDAVFLQAPLGYVNASSDKTLTRAMNSAGFYVEYGAPLNMPTWLNALFGTTRSFRLIEAIQPTENMDLYSSYTCTGTYNALKWLPLTTGSTTSAESASSYTSSVLAENVLLLIIRPRLDAQDEQTAAGKLGRTYNTSTQNSILCPDYNYDSRAWESGYSGPVSRTGTVSAAALMRNQLPPIVDVAMICADAVSVKRFQNSNTPPTELQVSSTLFTNSANLDADLATYQKQLSNAHIRYRLFRSAVNMQSAAWANN